MTTPQVKEQVSSSTEFLSSQEQTVCKQIAQGEAPYSQRAMALLELQSGSTQAQAAQMSGLSQGQVKYWLAQFKKQRLAIFPETMLEESKAKPEPKSKKAESTVKKAKKSKEKTVEVEKNEKDKKEKKGKKSKKSEKKAGKSKKDKKEKKGKKKKKDKNDKKKK